MPKPAEKSYSGGGFTSGLPPVPVALAVAPCVAFFSEALAVALGVAFGVALAVAFVVDLVSDDILTVLFAREKIAFFCQTRAGKKIIDMETNKQTAMAAVIRDNMQVRSNIAAHSIACETAVQLKSALIRVSDVAPDARAHTGRIWVSNTAPTQLMFTDSNETESTLTQVDADSDHSGYGEGSMQIGYNAHAYGDYSIALGFNAYTIDVNYTMAIGAMAQAYTYGSIAIGGYAYAGCLASPSYFNISLGYRAYSYSKGIAIGGYSVASYKSYYSIAIGQWANCGSYEYSHNIAIGYAAIMYAGLYSISIGKGAVSFGAYNVVLGYESKSHGSYSVIVGCNSFATPYSNCTTIVGYNSYSDAYGSVLGANSNSYYGCTVLGYGLSSDQAYGIFMTPVRTFGGGTILTWQYGNYELTMDVSSRVYKDNIRDAEDLSAVFDAVNVRRFTVKSNGSDAVGFIAEELAPHVPEMVPLDADKKPLGVRYDKLAVLLWQEAQRVRAEIKDTEAKLVTLRAASVLA